MGIIAEPNWLFGFPQSSKCRLKIQDTPITYLQKMNYLFPF